MVARFLHCKVTLSSFSTLHSWGKIHYTQLKIMSEELYSTSLRGKNLHKLFGFLLHKICLFFPVYHLFISVKTQRYLFYILGYNPILIYLYFAQIVLVLLVGSSSCWFLCLFDPLTYAPITHCGFFPSFLLSFLSSSLSLFLPFFFWNTSLLSGNTRSIGSFVSFPSPRISPFS